MQKDIVYNEDCLQGLKKLPDNSIDCCVTSPPYYGLRDYGVAGQLGLEEKPEIFVEKIISVFNEVKRILKPSGTTWINLGDSYSSTGTGSGDQKSSTLQGGKSTQVECGKRPSKINLPGIKPKDLIGIPWMVAFALRSAGWYLRQDIIWHKPNPMPESVTDRCTKSHEYIFLLSKSARYYYDADAIKTKMKAEAYHMIPKGWAVGPGSHSAKDHATIDGQKRKAENLNDKKLGLNGSGLIGHSGNNNSNGEPITNGFANKRSVWSVNPMPYSEAHFATFPEKLIVDCIKAGCQEGGIVLDPFMGAFTTALVAKKLGRHYIGFELNPDYIKIGKKRLQTELGMFNSAE